MDNFNFSLPTKIHFGIDKVNDLGTISARYGKRCLLVTTSNDEMVMHPLYDRIKGILSGAGVEAIHYDGIVPNPTIGCILKGIELAKEHSVDAIISVGGGSSIDASKTISLFHGDSNIEWEHIFRTYTNPFAVYDHFSKPPLPHIVVPTTAGTGSEVTQAIVISNPDKDEKMCIFHDKAFPVECIIDPYLTRTLPKSLTAITGFDAFCHAFESYMSGGASDFTKMLSIRALRLILGAMPVLMEDLNDMDARIDMCKAELYAGIGIANAGTDVPHPLASIVAGIAEDVPHGQSLASLYPAYVRFRSRTCTAKCAEISRLFDESLESIDDSAAAEKLPMLIDGFLGMIGMNKTFRQLGVTDEQFERMKGHFLFDVLPFAPKEQLLDIFTISY